MDSQSSDKRTKTPSARASRIALVVTVVVLTAAVTTAWWMDVGAPSDAYTVSVIRDGATIATFDSGALKSMEQKKIVAQNQDQEGPPLLSVLEAAGAGTFDSVMVKGAGLRDDGLIELNANQVDEDVVLDFAERGTVKVCGPKIAWEDRVRDVQVIEVR